MANIKVELFSNSLVRWVAFEMYIPNDFRTDIPRPHNPYYDRNCKTVFVLHGYTGWGKGWDKIFELAEKFNFALVFPSVENSFYLDMDATSGKYGTFAGSELIEYIRKTFGLCKTKEDTFISGLSMGGFGALRTGLAYPDTFGKIVALSSALIVHEIAGMKPSDSDKNGIGNYYYYRNYFGDLDKLIKSDNNPETLVEKLIQQKINIPKIYMACGDEDFLLETNRRFHRFLLERNVNIEYIESNGGHDMDFWNEYFAKGFEWLALNS
ncbi:MAG: alpha/beta hydrolase-fold protein [Treponema sp.]|nr:alpha/beta hydrolase-fold protein [Treponema sp.]